MLIVSCGTGRFSFYQISLFSYGIPDHAVLLIEFWQNVAENEGCAKRMMATLALLLDTSRWVGVMACSIPSAIHCECWNVQSFLCKSMFFLFLISDRVDCPC